jgi:hypothetical protein
VLSRGIAELFPRGKAKVLEGPGYLSLTILFIMCKGKAKILEGLGYLSIIVNQFRIPRF